MQLDPRASAAGVRLVAHATRSARPMPKRWRGRVAASAARSGSRRSGRPPAAAGAAARGCRSPAISTPACCSPIRRSPNIGPSSRSSRRSRSTMRWWRWRPASSRALAIKWPNDLLLSGREVRRHSDRGREAWERARSSSASASIARAIPQATDYPATDLAAAGAAVTPEALFCRALEQDARPPRAMERRGGLFHHPRRLARAGRRARAGDRGQASRPGDSPAFSRRSMQRGRPRAAPLRRQCSDHHRRRRVHAGRLTTRNVELIGLPHGALERRTRLCAARRGGRDRHESRALRLRGRTPAAVDHRRSRRGIRRR